MAGTMAASGPPPEFSPGWAEAPSSMSNTNLSPGDGDPTSTTTAATSTSTSGLELGMSGMSILPSNGGSPPIEEHVRSSGDSVHSYHSAGTASSANKAGITRPPGLGFSSTGPPPIGKPGHAKSYSNCSTTVQTATLTPTSSLDGVSNDLYGLTRQTSPSAAEHFPPGISNLGSFDTDDGDHDGLLGLQALRDRAQSSPGPPTGGYSTSPRELGGVRGVHPSQQGRPRTVSKDSGRSQSGSRPPLAGGSALSPHTSDGLGAFGGNRGRDASPPPNAGIISRPYSPYGSGPAAANDYDRSFDSSLRRALSSDSTGAADYGNLPGGSDHLSSKFNAPPFGGSQQRTGGSGSVHGQGMYHHRQQRSYSQPGPARVLSGPEYLPEEPPVVSRRGSDHGVSAYHVPRGGPGLGMENEYGLHHEPDMRYNMPVGGAHLNHHGRSMSMTHSPNNANYHDMHRRGSTGYFGGHPQRRDIEYDDGRRYSEQERIGNTNYPRQDRLISPAHSPMHMNYGNHSRQSSDMGSTVSSSPMSLTSGHQPLYGRHRITHSDEDLSHPLVGEHIEVPGEELYFSDGMVPFPRSSSMGHVSNYGVESHHLPTAGASIALPKLVYNVKFKRTQRSFELGPRLNRDLKVGTYVKVEADRGEDLGIVVGKVKNSVGRSSSFGGGMGDIPPTAGSGGDSKKIIRLATHDEVSLLQMKREEEEELLKVCRTKVRQRGLPMNVVDAEYQFDRHKLTFFFEAEGRIDFRELVRDLFSMYKTRIWMQQLDKSTSASCPVAPAPAPLVMDYGTPIIAPASEYEDFAQANGASDDGTD